MLSIFNITMLDAETLHLSYNCDLNASYIFVINFIVIEFYALFYLSRYCLHLAVLAETKNYRNLIKCSGKSLPNCILHRVAIFLLSIMIKCGPCKASGQLFGSLILRIFICQCLVLKLNNLSWLYHSGNRESEISVYLHCKIDDGT